MTHGLAVPDEVTGKLARTVMHPRRRAVLDVLDDAGEEVPLEYLCDRVVAVTSGPTSPEDRQAKDTQVSVVHDDLPLLEELGLVEVDRQRRAVDPGDGIESVRELRLAGETFAERLRRTAGRLESAGP